MQNAASDQAGSTLTLIKLFLDISTGSKIDAHITKTCLFKYTENFTTKNDNFSDEKF